jgi:hypothetical protein
MVGIVQYGGSIATCSSMIVREARNEKQEKREARSEKREEKLIYHCMDF